MGSWYKNILNKNEKGCLLSRPKGLKRRLGSIFLVQQEHKFKRQPCFFYKMCLREQWNTITLRNCSSKRSHRSGSMEKWLKKSAVSGSVSESSGTPTPSSKASLAENERHSFFFSLGIACTPGRSWHSSANTHAS